MTRAMISQLPAFVAFVLTTAILIVASGVACDLWSLQ